MLHEERSKDRVLTLTLAAPERRNALDYAAVRELCDALRAADGDPDVRAVLLQADGKVFSAGANLKEFQAELASSATDFYESGAVWEELFTLVPTLGTPLVIAVNGPARAGAVGLVALGDLVLASPSADFSLSEIKIGLFPIMVLPMVQRVVGYRAAQDLALTGRVIGAEEARAIGLISRVVGDDELRARAHEAAAELAASAPRALAYGRQLLARLADLPYAEAVHHARTMRGTFLHTPDIHEGVAAFLDKRAPEWHTPDPASPATQEDPS
ncbi:MAG: enoyl-CoA hydratase/isomerase family protein [Nitriliruptoraceae bacterium]